MYLALANRNFGLANEKRYQHVFAEILPYSCSACCGQFSGDRSEFVAVTWISVHVPIEWEKIGSMTRGREGPDFSPIPELSKSFSTSLESVCNNRLLGAIMGAVGAPMTRS